MAHFDNVVTRSTEATQFYGVLPIRHYSSESLNCRWFFSSVSNRFQWHNRAGRSGQDDSSDGNPQASARRMVCGRNVPPRGVAGVSTQMVSLQVITLCAFFALFYKFKQLQHRPSVLQWKAPAAPGFRMDAAATTCPKLLHVQPQSHPRRRQ
ncbi:hypothetical protein BJ322DRAFT_1094527 [Thelephora terrestris]|uniref:Uncharacterized protein n=1 Tax=Thelephora terrestris TaxID=56493 RepID=A0A9P6L116_9AGAM|nr:hypothetical protein BJ322DRAFT_1094527 [Thelephora terrestris]